MRALPLAAAAAALALGPPLAAAQEAPEQGPELTLYREGTGLVREGLTFDLRAGLQTVTWPEAPDALDPTSLTLSFPDRPGIQVLEAIHQPRATGTGAALEGLVGREVTLVVEGGRRVRGTLVSAADPVVLRPAGPTGPTSGGGDAARDGAGDADRDDDPTPAASGREGGPAGPVVAVPLSRVLSYGLPALPDSYRAQPRVRWRVRAPDPGTRAAELAYLVGGLSWDAEYVMELAEDETRFGLEGWASLTNGSGRAYRDARVKLVAGDVKRVGGEQPRFDARARMEMAQAVAAPAPTAEERGFGDFRLFELPSRVTVPVDGTVQSLLLRATDVPTEKQYRVLGGPGRSYGGRRPNLEPDIGREDEEEHALVEYLFSTAEEDGTGHAMPAGRVRVYRRDADGSLLLAGEDRIGDVPGGDSARVEIGRAFQVYRERTRTGFRRPTGTSLEEDFRLTVVNRREEPVEVRVQESLHRWHVWEITSARVAGEPAEPRKLDSHTVEWRVRVPAESEREVTYTVRYTWEPEDVR